MALGGVGLVNTEKSEFKEDDRLGYVHAPAPQVRGEFAEGSCAFCAAQFLWPEVFQSDLFLKLSDRTYTSSRAVRDQRLSYRVWGFSLTSVASYRLQVHSQIISDTP